MGLDVYVGSLVRYYTGNWETIVQQLGREQGVRVEVRRPQPKAGLLQRLIGLFRRNNTAAAARAVERWRRKLERELGTAVTWNEDPDVTYFTDKPAWDCYGALVLWAAYDEQPAVARAATAEQWSDDPAYLAAWHDPQSRYRHLIGDTEIWLPIFFPQLIVTLSVTGDPIVVGSSILLQAELRELNARTWAAGDDTISQWRAEGAEYGAPLETSARLAFSIFYELANESVRRRLPMKLDY